MFSHLDLFSGVGGFSLAAQAVWGEMFRVIQSFQPRWVIAENVRGLITISEGLVFEQVCTDLETAGYEVQPFIIPAVSVNAPHRRDRVWIVAHATSQRQQGQGEYQQSSDTKKNQDRETITATMHDAEWSRDWIEVAAELCGVDDGLPSEMDGLKLSKSKHREHRLKALGNAIVPAVAARIMEAIRDSDTL